MSLDIGDILNGWPFKPGEVNVRRIVGDDGREKIQLRLDLGLLQMETVGRPDGDRPNGFPSLLAYYEHQLLKHKEDQGSDEGFVLSEEACELLRVEGVMYYHRYLATFVLGDYAAVERDTRRNLRLLDFCKTYAENEQDKMLLEQYRPYILMMYARAKSRSALKQGRPKKALAVVKTTIARIKRFYQRNELPEEVEGSTELAVLRALAREIKELVPEDPRTKLRKQLRKAVEEERYEDAAHIRDDLEALGPLGEPE